MKKVLKKEIKNTTNAIRYFSSEIVTGIYNMDPSCGIVSGYHTCSC